MEQEKLIEKAIQASKNSYSPYSNFPVGAALLTKDGKIYQGCNIENASYGLSNCAERTCMFTAYADGIRKDDIVAFALYSPKDHMVSPGGACRQVMVELLPKDCPVYIVYGNKQYVKTNVEQLVPYSFSNEDL